MREWIKKHFIAPKSERDPSESTIRGWYKRHIADSFTASWGALWSYHFPKIAPIIDLGMALRGAIAKTFQFNLPVNSTKMKIAKTFSAPRADVIGSATNPAKSRFQQFNDFIGHHKYRVLTYPYLALTILTELISLTCMKILLDYKHGLHHILVERPKNSLLAKLFSRNIDDADSACEPLVRKKIKLRPAFYLLSEGSISTFARVVTIGIKFILFAIISILYIPAQILRIVDDLILQYFYALPLFAVDAICHFLWENCKLKIPLNYAWNFITAGLELFWQHILEPTITYLVLWPCALALKTLEVIKHLIVDIFIVKLIGSIIPSTIVSLCKYLFARNPTATLTETDPLLIKVRNLAALDLKTIYHDNDAVELLRQHNITPTLKQHTAQVKTHILMVDKLLADASLNYNHLTRMTRVIDHFYSKSRVSLALSRIFSGERKEIESKRAQLIEKMPDILARFDQNIIILQQECQALHFIYLRLHKEGHKFHPKRIKFVETQLKNAERNLMGLHRGHRALTQWLINQGSLLTDTLDRVSAPVGETALTQPLLQQRIAFRLQLAEAAEQTQDYASRTIKASLMMQMQHASLPLSETLTVRHRRSTDSASDLDSVAALHTFSQFKLSEQGLPVVELQSTDDIKALGNGCFSAAHFSRRLGAQAA